MPQCWGSYPHNASACPISRGFNPTAGLALPAPKSHEVLLKIAGSRTMWGNQPWHLVLLPGHILGRRQVKRHRNCHGEMQQGNNALNPPHVSHGAPVSWHSWAGSCWRKVELETHGVFAQPPGTLQSPVRTIQTLWVLYRATQSPYTPPQRLCTPWCGPCITPRGSFMSLWSHVQPMGTSHSPRGSCSPQAPHTLLWALCKRTCERAPPPTQAKALTQGQLFPYLLLSHEFEPCFGSPRAW